MADAHKAPAAGEGDSSGLVMFIIKVLVVLVVLLVGFALMVRNPESTNNFISFLRWIQVFAGIVIIGAIVAAIMMMYRFTPLNMALGNGYITKYKPPTDNKQSFGKYTDRLNKVENHIHSNSEAEWKLAVIELDGILRDVLKDNGYEGETVFDQLKSAETRPFATIQNAWDGHKVRNRIAHEGVQFSMDQHEARRVYGLYKSAFEEFKIL